MGFAVRATCAGLPRGEGSSVSHEEGMKEGARPEISIGDGRRVRVWVRVRVGL